MRAVDALRRRGNLSHVLGIASAEKLPRNDAIKIMANEVQYCVYIMTNTHNTVLYTGVTNNLERRVLEHRSGKGSAFTSKYRAKKLVYFECSRSNKEAITREKQIKAGSRKKKIALIESITKLE